MMFWQLRKLIFLQDRARHWLFKILPQRNSPHLSRNWQVWHVHGDTHQKKHEKQEEWFKAVSLIRMRLRSVINKSFLLDLKNLNLSLSSSHTPFYKTISFLSLSHMGVTPLVFTTNYRGNIGGGKSPHTSSLPLGRIMLITNHRDTSKANYCIDGFLLPACYFSLFFKSGIDLKIYYLLLSGLLNFCNSSQIFHVYILILKKYFRGRENCLIWQKTE